MHASPLSHANAAPQLDLLQQSHSDTHLSFASAPEEGLLQARMLSAAPAPAHAQRVLPPGQRKQTHTQHGEEQQSEALEAMHELPGLPELCWSPDAVGHFTPSSCSCRLWHCLLVSRCWLPGKPEAGYCSPSYPSSPWESCPYYKQSCGAGPAQQPCYPRAGLG